MTIEKCPSYDCGYCTSAPFPYSVKCKDLNCAWQEYYKNKSDEVKNGISDTNAV